MATNSSILAWEIPWTEKSHGLQPMGSQRDRTEQLMTLNGQKILLQNYDVKHMNAEGKNTYFSAFSDTFSADF